MPLVLDASLRNIVRCIWFACASAPQTFPRMSKSKQLYDEHVWRIFSGKLGECTFVEWLQNVSFLKKEDLAAYEKEAFSVYYGTGNVDRFDLKVHNKLIDIKTAPKPTHQYLIVPYDQWRNQVKDFYVGLRISYSYSIKDYLLSLSCKELGALLLNEIDERVKDFFLMSSIKVEIHGFLPRKSDEWEYVKERDAVCPEGACVRVKLSSLKSIEYLLESLK